MSIKSIAMWATGLIAVLAAAFIVLPAVTLGDTQVDVAVQKTERFPVKPLLSADIKVLVDRGHGSGVHIGNGKYLTAAHVVREAKTVKVKFADKSVREAKVLWVSQDYDIALLDASGSGVSVAKLSCLEPAVGTNITMVGNPMALEGITAFGRVAGSAQELAHWKSVIIVSGPSIPGQSGGPVYNEAHEVVGITVGLMGVNLGMFPSVSGYGSVVPMSAVCGLLAKG